MVFMNNGSSQRKHLFPGFGTCELLLLYTVVVGVLNKTKERLENNLCSKHTMNMLLTL